MARRVAVVLADYANYARINGLSSWEADDFRNEASKFVGALYGTAVNADILGLESVRDYAVSLTRLFLTPGAWGVPEGYTAGAVRAALAEVGEDLVPGHSFDELWSQP